MATGDKLVNLDELKLVYDKLHVPSVQVQIPTGQWSGSSTRTYTVNATGVTTDTIIDWAMDSSINYLTSELTVTPGSGTLTFSTPTLPAGTINVTLFFPGVNGEVVIQTLADVYSKSQTDTLLAAKVSTSNIVNNLTSTNTDKPLSAAQGKALKDLFVDLGSVSGSSIDVALGNAARAFIALNISVPCPAKFTWASHDHYVGVMFATGVWVKFNFSTTSDFVYGNYTISTQTVTIQSTATVSTVKYNNSNSACVHKVGRMCYITCTTFSWYSTAVSQPIRKDSTSGDEWIIPAGFRPIENCEIKEALYNKRITVTTDGKVICNEALSGTNLRFSGCYICAE